MPQPSYQQISIRPRRPRSTPRRPPEILNRYSYVDECRSEAVDHHTIPPATAADLPAVLEIYSAGIAERGATFETDPRSESDLAGWTTDSQPFIVATQAGRVVGFARAGSYSNRYVYQGIGEHAVYVHPTARSQGLGRRLLSALCDESERRGLYKLTSRIFTDNHPSRAAHHAAGFKEVGIQRRHGRLEGQWKDCVLVERLLGQAAIT